MTFAHFKSQPTFTEARQARMPFGKYQGKTLEEIAMTDDGLMYLDFMRGELLVHAVRFHIAAFLDDPTIAKDLRDLMDGGRR